MALIRYEIETAGGVYKINKPLGQVGSKHFGIIGRYIPTNIPDNGEMSPAQKESMFEGYELWSKLVLPKIYCAENSVPLEEMTGEDQYAIFIALTSDLKVSEDLFRIIR